MEIGVTGAVGRANRIRATTHRAWRYVFEEREICLARKGDRNFSLQAAGLANINRVRVKWVISSITLPIPTSKRVIHTLPKDHGYGFGYGYWVSSGNLTHMDSLDYTYAIFVNLVATMVVFK